MDILVIQLLRLGDALQITPIIRGLKDFFPEANISILTTSLGKQIFSLQPDISKIYEIRRDDLVSLTKSSRVEDMLSAIDILEEDLGPVIQKHWDWTINFGYSFFSSLLSFMADGEHSSGFCADRERRFIIKEKWFAYSVASFLNRKYSMFNWIDINKNVINLPAVPEELLFPLRGRELRDAEAHLRDIGFSGQRIIGMAPGASDDSKKWPVDNFVALGRSLTQKSNCKMILFGGEEEKDPGQRISSGIGPGCEDMTGKTTLSQLAAYLSKCDLLVTNDSGPMHMATAVATPVIGLFFSTHFVETGPYGPDNIAVFPNIDCFPCKSPSKCPRKKCLETIRPETIEKIVMNADQLMGQHAFFKVQPEDGPVAVNRSLFDPFGNLDWVPVDQRALTPDDLLRLVYKVFWLSSLKFNDQIDDAVPEYVKGITGRYSPIEQRGEAVDLLRSLGQELQIMERRYEKGYQLSLQIHRAVSSGEGEGAETLAGSLRDLEDEIEREGEKPCINPLAEYLKIRMDSLIEPNVSSLSIKTANIYNEARHLALNLKKESEKMSNFLRLQS